uniref:Putative secreted peptide n=1 Tax=Anopheles braziliensis TaxID=58242 RepID=A0A2M3ZVF1_9DIPT
MHTNVYLAVYVAAVAFFLGLARSIWELVIKTNYLAVALSAGTYVLCASANCFTINSESRMLAHLRHHYGSILRIPSLCTVDKRVV